MRSLVVLLALIATLLAVAQADTFGRCVVSKCSSEVYSCSLDPKCANAADCLSRCPPSAQSGCSRECTASAVYANLTACSSQCVSTGVADVISLVAPARADNIMAGCNAMKKAMCATAIAGAIVACGGPEDIPCILAALGALEGCVTCFCESKGCRGLCKHVC